MKQKISAPRDPIDQLIDEQSVRQTHGRIRSDAPQSELLEVHWRMMVNYWITTCTGGGEPNCVDGRAGQCARGYVLSTDKIFFLFVIINV